MPARFFLLADFGATHVKTALWQEGHTLGKIRVDAAPVATISAEVHCEISLHSIRELFEKLCREYENQAPLTGILLCSQMHGFAVLDDDDRPVTPYISWKDERSTEKIDGQSTFYKATRTLDDRYYRITGMHPRPGFPFFNLLHLARQGALPKNVSVVGLPDWLAAISGKSTRKSHPTMLAGLGLWNLDHASVDKDLAALCSEWTGVVYRVYDSADEKSIAGVWEGRNGPVPIYVGVGDHPCALLGAKCEEEKTVSVNIATGSQVARIMSPEKTSDLEKRPYFDGRVLHTLTHIPAGRALEIYLNFLAETSGNPGNIQSYWKQIDALTNEDIERSSLEIDLAIFKSAWGYKNGGEIRLLNDRSWTVHNYLASLVSNLVKQYVKAIGRIDHDHTAQEVILSGGLARKLRALPERLRLLTQLDVRPAADQDETLLGLQQIAGRIAEKSSHGDTLLTQLS